MMICHRFRQPKRFGRPLLLAFLGLVWILSLAALTGASEYAGEFLQIAVGARPLSLGGAYCSLTREGWAPYWNPAGCAFQQQLEISVQHATLFTLAQHEYANLALPLPNEATLGFSWIRLGVDQIPVFPEPGLTSEGALQDVPGWIVEADEFFADAEDAFIFTFAKMNRLDLDLGWQYFVVPMQIPVGVNLKYIRQSLGDAVGSGMGIDLGAQVLFGMDHLLDYEPLGDFAAGLNFQNIGKTALNWDTESKHHDNIPFNLKFGFSYIQPLAGGGTQAVIAYDRDTAYDGQNHLGLELAYRDFLALRLGAEGEELTMGAGLRVWHLSVDYAFVAYDLGNIHRVSGSVHF